MTAIPTLAEIDAIPEEEITYDLAMELFPPTAIGPTWKVNDDGSWFLPEKTLGWGILGWCAEWLVNPDDQTPWMFTPEQARFVLWFYEVDCNGKRTNRKAVFQRLKGHGKDPLAAALCMAELCGPVVFDGWLENGQPKGKRRGSSRIQIAAVNKEQALKNAVKFIPGMLPKKTLQEFKLDVQKESIQVLGRPDCVIEAISSASRGAEGNRVNFAVLDETHHWIPSQGGDELYRTINFNVKKGRGTMLCITNAYVPGEDSVAERIRYAYDQWVAGLGADPHWLYDSLEAHPDAPFDPVWGKHIVKICAGDSHRWVAWDDAAEDLEDASISVAENRRMWYNRVSEASDALYSEAEWDGAKREGLTGTKADLERGDSIVLGFDGGKTDDATALVAIRLRDKLIVPLAVWESPPRKSRKKDENKWEVDPVQVAGEIHMAFRYYDVKAFFADVHPWEPYIRQWSDQYRHTLYVEASAKSSIGYDMRGNKAEIVYSNEALMNSIAYREIAHNGDPKLRTHALNARRDADNPYGTGFRKESRESPKKVDMYAATLLAFIAMNKVLESDKTDPSRYNRTMHQH